MLNICFRVDHVNLEWKQIVLNLRIKEVTCHQPMSHAVGVTVGNSVSELCEQPPHLVFSQSASHVHSVSRDVFPQSASCAQLHHEVGRSVCVENLVETYLQPQRLGFVELVSSKKVR